MITNFEIFEESLTIKNNKIFNYIVNNFNKKEIKSKLLNFKNNTKNQALDYKKVSVLIKKFLKKEKLTVDDYKLIKKVIIDTFKISTLTGIFLLPAGSIWLTALIKLFKKFNIDIIPDNFKLNENYNFNDLLNQIKKSRYNHMTYNIWEDLLLDGYPEEFDDYNPDHYKYLKLDISDNDKEKLINFDNDIIEKYNEFDILLKDNGYYPKYLDFINYETGELFIIKYLY